MSAIAGGHIESISLGISDRDNSAGPELLANANPTFEWVRLAQRNPVRIHIDDVPKGVVVSAGITCTVVVEAPASNGLASPLCADGNERPSNTMRDTFTHHLRLLPLSEPSCRGSAPTRGTE